MGTLWHYGYTGTDIDQLISVISDGGVLLDCRMSNRSRAKKWEGYNLRNVVTENGGIYVHAKGFGNANFRDSNAPMSLYNPDPFAKMAADYLKQGRHVVVMCACSDIDSCHRKLVLAFLNGWLHVEGRNDPDFTAPEYVESVAFDQPRMKMNYGTNGFPPVQAVPPGD